MSSVGSHDFTLDGTSHASTNRSLNHPMITLTFQGVDFRFLASKIDSMGANADSSSSNGITFHPDASGRCVSCSLTSFTGTLLVTPAPDFLINPITPKVEEEPLSACNTIGISPDDRPRSSSVGQFGQGKTIALGHSGNILPDGQCLLPFLPNKQTEFSIGTHSEGKLKRGRASGKISDTDVVPKRKKEVSSQKHSDNPFQSDSNVSVSVKSSSESSMLIESEYQTDDSMQSTSSEKVTAVITPPSIVSSTSSNNPSIRSTVDKNLPTPRWGHTMTCLDEKRILIYGGQTIESDVVKTLSDIYVYDLLNSKWTKPINCDGEPRTWHSATLLPDRQLIISFGGERFDPKTNKTITNDKLMVFDTEIMLWYPPSVSGVKPSGRSGHTANLLLHTNELVIFGGVKNNKWQNSIAVLDTMTWKWRVPKVSGDVPKGRSYHSATCITRPLIGDSGKNSKKVACYMVVFGGNNDIQAFNTVHVLDTGDGSEDALWHWSRPNVSGTPPSPRTGHTATLMHDQKTILVYGGWDPCSEDDESNNSTIPDEELIKGDSFLLDTETWTWRQGSEAEFIDSNHGACNSGRKRTGHTTVLVNKGANDSFGLVFGGRVPDDTFACDFQSLKLPSTKM